MTRLPQQRGFVLLLTVLITGVLLAIALGVLNVLDKALLLSSLGEESQKAYYASDNGTECAFYWDLKHAGFPDTVFATSTASTPPGAGQGITCAGQDINPAGSIVSRDANSATSSFSIIFANGTCVTVGIYKRNDGLNTVVESFGHNTCAPGFTRRLERATRNFY